MDQEEKGLGHAIGSFIHSVESIHKPDLHPGDGGAPNKPGKRKKRWARYVPNPKDPDGDRLVQEGTIHERRVNAPGPVAAIPKKISKIRKINNVHTPDPLPESTSKLNNEVDQPSKQKFQTGTPPKQKPKSGKKLPPAKKPSNAVETALAKPKKIKKTFQTGTPPTKKKPSGNVINSPLAPPKATKKLKKSIKLIEKIDTPVEEMDADELFKKSESLVKTGVDPSQPQMYSALFFANQQILEAIGSGKFADDDLKTLKLNAAKIAAAINLKKQQMYAKYLPADGVYHPVAIIYGNDPEAVLGLLDMKLEQLAADEKAGKVSIIKYISEKNRLEGQKAYIKNAMQPGAGTVPTKTSKSEPVADMLIDEIKDPQLVHNIVQESDGPVWFAGPTRAEIVDFVNNLDSEEFDSKVDEIDFQGFFKDSAGNTVDTLDPTTRYGVVAIDRKTGKVLMVEPKNHYGGYAWTFPKGGRDTGESMSQAARRELKEESGLDVKLVGALSNVFQGTTSRTALFVGLVDVPDDYTYTDGESQSVKLFDIGEEAISKIQLGSTVDGIKRDISTIHTLRDELNNAIYNGFEKTAFDTTKFGSFKKFGENPKFVAEKFKKYADTKEKKLINAGASQLAVAWNSLGFETNHLASALPSSSGSFDYDGVADGIGNIDEAIEALESGAVDIGQVNDSILADVLLKSIENPNGRFSRLNHASGVNDWAVPFSEHAKGTFVIRDKFTNNTYIMKTPVRDDMEHVQEIAAAITANQVGLPIPVPRVLGDLYVQDPVDAPGMPGGQLTKGGKPTSNRYILIEHIENVLKRGEGQSGGNNAKMIGRMLAQQYLIGERDNHSDNRIAIPNSAGHKSIFAFDAGKAFSPHDTSYGDEKFGGQYASVLNGLTTEERKIALEEAATAIRKFSSDKFKERFDKVKFGTGFKPEEIKRFNAHQKFVADRAENWEGLFASTFGSVPEEKVEVPATPAVREHLDRGVSRIFARLRRKPRSSAGLTVSGAVSHDGGDVRGRRVLIADGFRLRRTPKGDVEQALEYRLTVSDSRGKKIEKLIASLPEENRTAINLGGSVPIFGTDSGNPFDPAYWNANGVKNDKGYVTNLLSHAGTHQVDRNEYAQPVHLAKLDENTFAMVYPRMTSKNSKDREHSLSRTVRVFNLGSEREAGMTDETHLSKTLAKLGISDKKTSVKDSSSTAMRRMLSTLGGGKGNQGADYNSQFMIDDEARRAVVDENLGHFGLSVDDVEARVTEHGDIVPSLKPEAANKLWQKITESNPKIEEYNYGVYHTIKPKNDELTGYADYFASFISSGIISPSIDRVLSDTSLTGSSSLEDMYHGSGNGAYYHVTSYMSGVKGASGGKASMSLTVIADDPKKFMTNLDAIGFKDDSYGNPTNSSRIQNIFRGYADGVTFDEVVVQNPSSFRELGLSAVLGSGNSTIPLSHLAIAVPEENFASLSDTPVYLQIPTGAIDPDASTFEKTFKVGKVEFSMVDGRKRIRVISGKSVIFDSENGNFTEIGTFSPPLGGDFLDINSKIRTDSPAYVTAVSDFIKISNGDYSESRNSIIRQITASRVKNEVAKLTLDQLKEERAKIVEYNTSSYSYLNFNTLGDVAELRRSIDAVRVRVLDAQIARLNG